VDVIPGLSEAWLRARVPADIFNRGAAYLRSAAVLTPVRRGQSVEAQVQGSEPVPYAVRIDYGPTGIVGVQCSCPYALEWTDWCKHVVAVVLGCIQRPEAVAEASDLEDELAALDASQLRAVLQRLVKSAPYLASDIEVVVRSASAGGAGTGRTAPTPEGVRAEVNRLIRSLDRMRPSEAYWHVSGVVSSLRTLLGEITSISGADGDPDVFPRLVAFSETYGQHWTDLDGSDGDTGDLWYDVGAAWVGALLSSPLPDAERAHWADWLSALAGDLGDYGVDEAMDTAIMAATTGWSDPTVRQVLAGQPVPDTELALLREREEPELLAARFSVLATQGREEEYLRLARATGHDLEYAAGLVRTARFDEAATHAIATFRSAGQALALARQLHAAGATGQALSVAERGLALEEPRSLLATWLFEAAQEAGQHDRALLAAGVAFQETPTLSLYQQIQQVAGSTWPGVKAGLLDSLASSSLRARDGAVDVWLHEGMIDEAVAAVRNETWDYRLLEKVVSAAVTSHPEWAIGVSRQQAEGIIERGDSAHYDAAARWLDHAREASAKAGQQAQWDAYLRGLMQMHSRKYKLVPLLQAMAKRRA